MLQTRLASRPASGAESGMAIGKLDKRDQVGTWRSRILRSLALLAIVLLVALIIADTAGHNLATSEPRLAIRIAPWQAIALNELAQKEFGSASGELDTSEDLARRALLSDPLDSRALSLLGAAAERGGDLSRAEALMSRAASRTWRNPGPHFWLFAQAIRRGKFDEAIAQADGVLRVSPANSATIFPILSLFALDPSGMTALEQALAANPPWRSAFLSQAVATGANESLMTRLYKFLMSSKQPPTTLEMKPYIDRLIQMGRLSEAHENWRATSLQASTPTYSPYNGDFAAPIDGTPFNWVFDLVSGAEIDILEMPGEESKRALRIQFSGARVTLGRVGQLLLLAPGDYLLEFSVKTEDLRTERGLLWQVSCNESRSVLVETVPVKGTMPWTDLKLTFSVPPGCNAQWLKLVLPARTASESEIEGEVWFQRFRIIPADFAAEQKAS